MMFFRPSFVPFHPGFVASIQCGARGEERKYVGTTAARRFAPSMAAGAASEPIAAAVRCRGRPGNVGITAQQTAAKCSVSAAPENTEGTDPGVSIDETFPAGTASTVYLPNHILDSKDVEEFLDVFAGFSARKLSPAGGEVFCGVTLLRRKRPSTVASSGQRAREMDEIQYNYGDGPCLAAAREQATIHVRDVRLERRWPDYIEAVRRYGIRSILAVPFALGSAASAALNLYSEGAGSFNPAAISLAENYAVQTAAALRLMVRLAERDDAVTDLKSAMESRTTIDVAVGIIMGQSRCSQEKAVRTLQTASSNRNIKLRELAATIVGSVGQGGTSTHFDT